LLNKKLGCFELIGCDIIIDENYKPYLLELNTNPAIHTDTSVKKEVITDTVHSCLDIVLEIHKNHMNRLTKLKNCTNKL